MYPLHLCLMGNGGWEELVRKGLVLGVGSMPLGEALSAPSFRSKGSPRLTPTTTSSLPCITPLSPPVPLPWVCTELMLEPAPLLTA